MTKLSCVLLFLLGSEVAGLAQTIEPADALFVEDAKGSVVGRVLNTGVEKSWFEVAFRVVASGEYVRLQLFKDRIEGDATPQFESTDCSGAAYVLPARNLFDAATAVGPPGHTLYVQRAGAEPRPVAARSCVEEDACGVRFCLQDETLVPADPVVDLDTLFSPPFRLVGSPLVLGPACCGDCDGDREVEVGELVRAVANGLNSCAGSR